MLFFFLKKMTIDSQIKNFISKSDKNVRTKTRMSCKPTENLVQTLYERGKNRNNVVTSYRVLQQQDPTGFVVGS